MGRWDALEAEYAAKRVGALQEVVVDEPVMGALTLSRRGLYTQKLLGRFGFLPWLLARMFAKKQAGGLPQSFIVAITPTKIRAFAYKAHGRTRDRFEIGDELAVWERSDVAVSWEPGPPFQIDVTIESPSEDERVLCRCGQGSSSEEALRMMAGPAVAV